MLSAPKASEIASGLGVVPATVLAVVAGLSLAGCSAGAGATGAQTAVVTSAPEPGSVNLSDSQLQAVKLGPAATHSFALRRSAVGSIDFDENRSVQVFSQYPGKIIQTFAEVGDEIQRGKILYSIDSPDLVQAESALIAAAGVANLTSAALARAEDLYETQGMAQKDYQ